MCLPPVWRSWRGCEGYQATSGWRLCDRGLNIASCLAAPTQDDHLYGRYRGNSGLHLLTLSISAYDPELPFGRASEFATGAFPLPIALRDGERVRVRGSHLLGVAKKSLSTSKTKEAYDAQRADYLKLWAGPRYSHLSRKLWLQVPTVLVAAPHPALSPSQGRWGEGAMWRHPLHSLTRPLL